MNSLDSAEVAPCQSERYYDVMFAEPLIGLMTEEVR